MIAAKFFQDLAMLMAVAGLVSAVFGRLGWPKVIGYILAGVFMNPYTWGGSLLADAGSVGIIGQLGVVFLMFSMGLDFSARSLKRIRGVVIPAAALDTVVMTWLGYMIGTRFLGWGPVAALFLGAAICDSATTMLAKVIGEMGWSSRPFVALSLGTSVCEDIVCVGIIALVTGVATGEGMSLGAAAVSIGWLGVFFLAVLVFGLILLPRLLNSVSKTKDDEALVLTTLGWLFFVSYIAYRFDFSLALGAFLVGFLSAASDVRGRLKELASPLKSMFAAVFFVSVGLLVDPAACWRFAPTILVIALVVIVGKFLNNTLVALVAGERLKTAVQMGMSLAQIGEFAFMVALIYLSLTGDYRSPIFQIVVAVSLLTTLLNPLMIRFSEAAGEGAERRLPARLRTWHETYRAFVGKLRQGGEWPQARRQAAHAAIALGVLAVLVFAVSVGCGLLTRFDYSRFSAIGERYDREFFFLVANFFALAVLPLLMRMARQLGEGVAGELVGATARPWHVLLRQSIMRVVMIAVAGLYFIEVSMVNVSLAPPQPWLRYTLAALFLITAIVGWKFFQRICRRAVTRLDESLSAEERQEAIAELVAEVPPPEGCVVVPVPPTAVGATVVTMNLRARTGATVVAVRRDGKTLYNPGPQLVFAAGDRLMVALSRDNLSEVLALLAGGETA